MCVNTYEKFEMDADCWKNDAGKVNEMKSAAVNHEIGSYCGGKMKIWDGINWGKKTVFEVVTEMRSAMVKVWKWEKHIIKENTMRILVG